MKFNNTTALNSTIYFCRLNNNEFNYSTNPTFVGTPTSATPSQILTKGNDPAELSKTYITTIGLYSADNQLLAVAKLSEPIRKDQSTELTFRIRLDY